MAFNHVPNHFPANYSYDDQWQPLEADQISDINSPGKMGLQPSESLDSGSLGAELKNFVLQENRVHEKGGKNLHIVD